MNKTTLFDLQQTARPVAINSVGKDAFTQENVKLEGFNAAGHDKLDYPKWNEFYAQELAGAASLQKVPSPATIAANAATPATIPAPSPAPKA